MSRRPGDRRPLARGIIQLVLILLGVLLIGAGPSSAAPTIPGVPDCKDAPAPQRPGDGLAGFLDPAPDKPAPPADPFVPNATTSIYGQYGYAGLTWHTYDLGCGGDLRDPGATSDNLIGNLSLSAATGGTALANGVHNRVAHPQTYMAPLDSVVSTVSDRIKSAIWGPWGGVALLGVVVLLLWYSSSGRLSSVTRAAAWAILVLTVLAGVTQYPTRIAAFFDDVVTTAIGQVNAGTAGLSDLPSASDPAHAQGSLLVDRILYESWVRGELGSSTSPAAKKWGPTLFRESAFSYDEARQAQDPKRAQQLTDQKAQDFKATAGEIQQQDPAAYLALQGKTNGRAGVGFMTLVAAIFTTLFRLVADIFMFHRPGDAPLPRDVLPRRGRARHHVADVVDRAARRQHGRRLCRQRRRVRRRLRRPHHDHLGAAVELRHRRHGPARPGALSRHDRRRVHPALPAAVLDEHRRALLRAAWGARPQDRRADGEPVCRDPQGRG